VLFAARLLISFYFESEQRNSRARGNAGFSHCDVDLRFGCVNAVYIRQQQASSAIRLNNDSIYAGIKFAFIPDRLGRSQYIDCVFDPVQFPGPDAVKPGIAARSADSVPHGFMSDGLFHGPERADAAAKIAGYLEADKYSGPLQKVRCQFFFPNLSYFFFPDEEIDSFLCKPDERVHYISRFTT
jgi:hypothetical protein